MGCELRILLRRAAAFAPIFTLTVLKYRLEFLSLDISHHRSVFSSSHDFSTLTSVLSILTDRARIRNYQDHDNIGFGVETNLVVLLAYGQQLLSYQSDRMALI